MTSFASSSSSAGAYDSLSRARVKVRVRGKALEGRNILATYSQKNPDAAKAAASIALKKIHTILNNHYLWIENRRHFTIARYKAEEPSHLYRVTARLQKVIDTFNASIGIPGNASIGIPGDDETKVSAYLFAKLRKVRCDDAMDGRRKYYFPSITHFLEKLQEKPMKLMAPTMVIANHQTEVETLEKQKNQQNPQSAVDLTPSVDTVLEVEGPNTHLEVEGPNTQSNVDMSVPEA